MEAIEDKDEVIIFSRKGLALRIEGNIIRAQGRTASGVTGMRLAEDDAIVGLSKYKEGEDIFVVSEEGYGKRLGFEEFAAKGRGGKGMAYLKVTEKNGFSVGTGSVGNEDEVILITQQGMTIRINAFDISKLGRTAVGVRIVDLKDNDKVQDFTVLGES